MRYKIHFTLAILFICFFSQTNAQNVENLLVGRTYSKVSSGSNKTTLKFKNMRDGVSESISVLLGRTTSVSLKFTYAIKGTKLTITYDEGLGVEEYIIDDAKRQLTSTHLQGYVDGKWGKIYWKRED